MRQTEGGMGKFTFLFFATIVGSAFYVAYMIFPIYYKYWDLQSDFDQMAKLGQVELDPEIRKRLNGFLREQRIPKEYVKQIKIQRAAKGMTLSLNYEEDLYLFDPWQWKERYIKTYKFEVYSEAQW